MASNYIKINTTALRHDAGELDSLVARAEKLLKDIDVGMGQLDRKWDGQANMTFIGQYAKDALLFQDVCKMIRNYSSDLKNAAGEYERCENAVNDLVRNIKV